MANVSDRTNEEKVKRVNALEMMRGSFSKVSTDSEVSDDIQKTPKNQANTKVSGSRGSTSTPEVQKSDIRGLTPSKPEDVEAREKSLLVNNPPSSEVDPDAAKTYAGNIKDAVENKSLTNYTDENNRTTDGTLPRSSAIPDEISDDEMTAEKLSEFVPNFNPSPTTLEPDTKTNRFFRVKKALHNAGFNMSNSEVLNLIQCNFKVKFPWGPILMNISKGLTELTGMLISMLVTVVGLGATAAGTAILPILGTLAGGSVTAIGIGMGLIVFVTGIVITIIATWLKFRYLHNASDAIQKVSFMRRQIYRYFIRRFWRFFLGGSIPLVGWLLNIFENILSWRHLKKVVGRLEKIVSTN